VHHALLVRVIERARRLARDAKRVFDGQLVIPMQPVAQALPLDEGHGEPELAGDFAGVKHGQDVGMLKPGRDLDLAVEALRADRRG